MRHAVAADVLALLGPQRRAHAIGQQRLRRRRLCLQRFRRAAEQLGELGVLPRRLRARVGEPPAVLPPQQESAQLAVDRRQKARKADAAVRKIRGKVAAAPAPLREQRGRRVVERVVGLGIVALPADRAQRAAAAHALRRAVEDHRRVFVLRLRRAHQAVVQLAQRKRGRAQAAARRRALGLLRLRGIRFRLLRRKPLAAEQPVWQHEEEERRAKTLVEQDQALLRVQRQREQEERHAPQQRRAHAPSPALPSHRKRAEAVDRCMEEAPRLRRQIHGKPDAERRRQRRSDAAVVGEQHHEQHRKDTPRRKAVFKPQRRRRHQHTGDDHQQRRLPLLLIHRFPLKHRAGAHRRQHGKRNAQKAQRRPVRPRLQQIHKLHRKVHQRRHRRQEAPRAIPPRFAEGVVRRVEQHRDRQRAQRVGKVEEHQRSGHTAEQRGKAALSASRRGDKPEGKGRIAAEKLRAAEHCGQQEAGGAGSQRLPSFQFYGKLSTLQGLSTSRSFFLIVAERRQKARRKSAAE